ncbi:hypothetical protein Ccrd_022156 [Cynara cardunculus var. scolymus]|uniref:Uncharacterized protein n=1 Tax=Cynara cardunculus var. scolymus TaxID=59895 RepID=A0A103XZ76_CYNCS|nr:hypothetical protein Ccrd_022156 [Cynara cardunculus var. scolymus]
MAMGNKGMGQNLLKLGVANVEYKRIPCDYKGKNLAVTVEESSQKPTYLAVKFLYQVDQTSFPTFQSVDEPMIMKNELLAKVVSIARNYSDALYKLCAIAKSPPASQLEREKLFKDDVNLFNSHGKNELAAECFYPIGL